jgi:hypothetical protein
MRKDREMLRIKQELQAQKERAAEDLVTISQTFYTRNLQL